MRNSKIAALLCALVIPVPAVSAEGNFDIGIIDSQTGVTAVAGTADYCGASVAALSLNEKGGIKGRQIRLTLEDDQSRPANATQAAVKLTSAGIKYFVGGASSNTVLAEIPIFKDAGVLFMGGTAKADQVLQSGGHVVRLNSNNAQDGRIIGEYVSNTLKAKTIAFVSLKGAYGEGAVASIKAALDPSITIKNVYFAPAETTNFQSILTSVVSDDVDAVVWAMYGNSQPVAFMRQYKQFGLDAVSVAAVGTLTASLVDAAGGAAEDLISADIWLASLDTPENNALREAYDKYKDQVPACGKTPLDKQIAMTYSQVVLLARAIEKTGSEDPAELRKALLDNEWTLPQGIVHFGPDGQAKATYHLTVVKGDAILPASDSAAK